MGPPPELQNGKVVQSLNETLDPSVREFAAADPTYAPPNLWRYRSDHEPGFSAPPPAHHYVEPGGIWWLCLALWLALIALAGWQLGGWLESRLVWVAGIGAWRWLAIVAPLFALLADWRESSLNHKTTLEPEGMEAEKRLAWMDVYLTVRLGAIAAATAGLGILAFKLGWTWLRRDLSLPGPLWGSLVWLLVSVFLWVWFQTTLAWSEGPMTDAGLGSIVQLQRERTPSGVQRRLTRWAGSSGNGERRQVLMPVVRALWRDMLAFIPVYTVFLFLGSWVALSLAKLYFWEALRSRASWDSSRRVTACGCRASQGAPLRACRLCRGLERARFHPRVPAGAVPCLCFFRFHSDLCQGALVLRRLAANHRRNSEPRARTFVGMCPRPSGYDQPHSLGLCAHAALRRGQGFPLSAALPKEMRVPMMSSTLF